MPVSPISWEALEQNSESKELGFEQFNFQLAFILFHKFGVFDYDYNTPGSEFYLTLDRDCPDLHAKKGDVVGWQAKFWLNRSDFNNTSLSKTRRGELVDGFNKSLEYKSKLATWVVCTPGQPINTKPHCSKDKLIKAIKERSEQTTVMFWNKPLYEALRSDNFEKLAPVYSHYFGEIFIGRGRCFQRTKRSIQTLKDKFDIDCHVSGAEEQDIISKLNPLHSITSIKYDVHMLQNFGRDDGINKDSWSAEEKETLRSFSELAEYIIVEIQEAKNLYDITPLLQQFIAVWNKFVKIYNQKESDFSHISDYYIDRIQNVGDLLFESLKPAVHIWGNAGSGKTCLAASLASHYINIDTPVVLLTGRELSGPASISSQIVEKLGLSTTWTLKDVFACLNNLGFLSRRRIPLIVDGLNETFPNCYLWRDVLIDIIDQIREFPYLILITTSRPSYSSKIFGCSEPSKIKYGTELTGFSETEAGGAVRKYFKKYDIAVSTWPQTHHIFRHPLLLKLFCLANQGKVVNEVTHESVFLAVQEYQKTLIATASVRGGESDVFQLRKARRGIQKLAMLLWDQNARSVAYDKLPELLDEEAISDIDWRDSITCKLLDEGLFLARDISEDCEVVEFSYDLVAGMVIAEAVFFSGKQDPKQLIKEQTTLGKLHGNGSGTHQHPLSEDIYGALIYLWPQHNNGELLIEVDVSDQCIMHTFKLLDLVCSTEDGCSRIAKHIKSITQTSGHLRPFAESVIDSAVNHHCFTPATILFDLMKETGPCKWIELCEAIYSKRYALSSWLSSVQKTERKIETSKDVIAFCAILLSTPLITIRDKAVHLLIELGNRDIDALQTTIKDSVKFCDVTILEGLLCALCGNILRTIDAQQVAAKAEWLKAEIVSELTTTHVMILDFCDTIFSYAEHVAPNLNFTEWQDLITLHAWEQDDDVEENCTEHDADWGYGPMGYDFARSTLNQIVSPYKEGALSKKEATSLMINRVKTLGYDINQLRELDIKIREEHEQQEYKRVFYHGSHQDKLVKWVFYELWGKLLLEGALEATNKAFRTPYCRIDPTSPCKPPKQQFVLNCYMPAQDEEAKEWAHTPIEHPFFPESRRIISSGDHRWILLDCRLTQTGKKDTCLTTSGHLFRCRKTDQTKLIEEYHIHGLDICEKDLNHTMAGEIPWRPDYEEDGWCSDYSAEPLIEHYNWSSYDEHTEHPTPTSHTPIFRRFFANELNLTFSVKGMTYYDQSGVPATKFIWDNTSRFLFLREDLFRSIVTAESGFIWCERSFKRYREKEKITGLRIPPESDIWFAMNPAY